MTNRGGDGSGKGKKGDGIDLSAKPRMLQGYQAYIRLYSAKVSPIVAEKWQAHLNEHPGVDLSKTRLSFTTKVARDLFKCETQEIKDEVEKYRRNMNVDDHNAAGKIKTRQQ